MTWFSRKIENALCKCKALWVFGNTHHHVHYTAKVAFPQRIEGKGRLIIGPHCVVNAFGTIILDGEVHLSEGASIYSVGFDTKLYPKEKKHKGRRIRFQGRCWMCANSMVGPGATIKDGDIVAPFTLRSQKDNRSLQEM